MRKTLATLVFVFILFFTCGAQSQVVPTYQQAAKFSPNRISKMLFSTAVAPHWLKKSNKFWYSYKTRDGELWYIVDPVSGTKKKLFDNDHIAAEISKIVKDPFDGLHLPPLWIKFNKDETAIQFDVTSSEKILKKEIADSTKKTDSLTKDTSAIKADGLVKDTASKKGKEKPKAEPKEENKIYHFEFDITSQTLKEIADYKEPKIDTGWASFSHDKKWVIYGKNYNLFYMDTANYEKYYKDAKDSTIVEYQLTFDGVVDYSYGNSLYDYDKVDSAKRYRADISWSPNGKYFHIRRTDLRKVKDLWIINNTASPRPTLKTYKYQMPGEKEAPIDELHIINFETKQKKLIKAAAFKDQNYYMWTKTINPLEIDEEDRRRCSYWQGTNERLYFGRMSRDLKKYDVCYVDVKTDTAITLIEERMNIYIDAEKTELVNDGKELIQWSERDGWGHFYLYDGNGKLKNQITKGPFHCEGIEKVDEKNRVLYFTACGREKGEDPYYKHPYKINFDGTGLTLLNSGNYNHEIDIDYRYKYFVSNFSRVNTAPQSNLYDVNGKLILALERTDLSGLFEAGYKFPEPFTVKADDGITNLYGVMYKPFDFDSTKKYPLIEYVYPGPQTEAVNQSFGRSMDRIDRLAQIGFIVITVGNRGGSPMRSKWYHNYGYGNLRDYGLADKKTAAEQLANRYKYININKVGIHGHSGGGFMSTAAMLVYPDFFKVAVSSAGNHDNNIYNRWWSEKHHGIQEKISQAGDTSFVYSIEKNADLARNLKGHLMLSTGDVDDNVHPANTIRVARALIAANKRFELVVLPGQAHGYGTMTEYFFWKYCDFFSTHLLGSMPTSIDLDEYNNDIEKKR